MTRFTEMYLIPVSLFEKKGLFLSEVSSKLSPYVSVPFDNELMRKRASDSFYSIGELIHLQSESLSSNYQHYFHVLSNHQITDLQVHLEESSQLLKI